VRSSGSLIGPPHSGKFGGLQPVMIGIIVWAGANECDLIEIDVASREALAQVSKIQMKTMVDLPTPLGPVIHRTCT